MNKWQRFDTALLRCLTEVEIVSGQRIAWRELARLRPDSIDIRSGFLGLSRAALNFSTQGRLALVLEKSSKKNRSGFWWLHNFSMTGGVCNHEPKIDDIAYLNEFSKKLAKLRNNTLFHIGKPSLQDPKRFREDMDITNDDFDRAVSLTLDILRNLLALRRSSPDWTQGGKGLSQMDYDGSDIARLICNLDPNGKASC